MWSCVLLTDAAAEATDVSGVGIVPVGTGRDLIAAVDAVGHRASTHVVVAAPAALATELATTTTVAAGRWPDLRLARLVSPHAPLAILSALALARATTDWPAFGVGLANALLQRSWSGAWTPDVSRLAHPAPSLAQHARSLLPGSGFLVRQAPDAAVLGGEPAADDVPPAGLDRVLLAEHGPGQDAGVSTVPADVVDRLARATGVTATRQLAVPGSWTSVYGTARAAQLALVPAQPSDLLAAVSHHCPSCGLEQPAAVCPFCHVIGRSLVSVAHPSPGPPPATPHAGLPVLGGVTGGTTGGAEAVAPPPAAGAAR
jgi:hypothetical protein